jgi:TetR/AcrR family transcriptional regulator, transcriptional repressor for nem operon
MRYNPDHKQMTRQRVLAQAASAIREKGPAGVGVADIMARAGLTHGGFYAHFASKDDLVAEAIGVMFEEVRGRFFGRMPDGSDPHFELTGMIDAYLSPEHRDMRDHGCPLPALSADLARLEPASRQRFGKGLADATQRLSEIIERLDGENPHSAASAMLSQMVGAVALARAVADPAQSDAILKNVRRDLKQRYGLQRQS